ncbi:MAG: cytochrome c [Hyphomicrobiaceae bacterium]|nr:cytochrome c [Hyphomicrobiaceae bacterium]
MTVTRLKIFGLVAATVLTGLSAGVARAQEKDLAAEGRALALQHCARCHAVDRSDVSKLPIAPPFRTFAAKWPVESLEEALAEGIVTGHPDMPVFQFEPEQIAALLEHLTEIAEKPKPQ